MNVRSGVWVALLGLAVTGCQKEAPPPAIAVTSATGRQPTEILKDFVMNDVRDGIKNMTLHSIESRIYESEHVADVDKPILYFYKDGKESSRLTAPSGRLQTETHQVECWGGVTIVSTDSSTLTTDRLRYDPKIQKIFSDDPVHMEKPDSVTDGIGLVTDPGLKVVKIGHQKVRFKEGGNL